MTAAAGTVPTLTLVFMLASMLLSIAIPIGLMVFIQKRTGANFGPFFVGCVTFIAMALILEGIVNGLILASPAGAAIQKSIWLYAIFGGLMAGLFEETGRFIVFKKFVKDEAPGSALAYGAGHGGIEAILVIGVSMLSNIALAALNNAGQLELLTSGADAAATESIRLVIDSMVNTPSWMYIVGIGERILAIALHLALSVIVFIGVRKNRVLLYPAAILIHAAMDAVAVIINDFAPNVLITEGCIAVFTVLAGLFAVKLWKDYTAEMAAKKAAEDAERAERLAAEKAAKAAEPVVEEDEPTAEEEEMPFIDVSKPVTEEAEEAVAEAVQD